MIHLRIVVPSYQAEHALDLLEHTETVCNIVYLERAARRPEGDVILCDVARDDASVLIGDLRELDIDTEGSIALEEIDSQVSAAAARAEGAAEGGADPVVWEELTTRTSESTELTHSFLLFMLIAMQIAAVGIYFDQPILIIGAMVVGPEFGPIAGICVAIISRRTEFARRSARALLVGFPLGIALVVATTLLFRATDLIDAEPDFGEHFFTRFLAEPDFFSFYVAALAGVVGMLSLTSAKSSVLVGVLISVATIPAAANLGVTTAYGDLGEAGGALLQLLVNLGTIFATGLATLYVQRRIYVARRHRHLGAASRKIAGLPVGSSRRARVDPDEKPRAT